MFAVAYLSHAQAAAAAAAALKYRTQHCMPAIEERSRCAVMVLARPQHRSIASQVESVVTDRTVSALAC